MSWFGLGEPSSPAAPSGDILLEFKPPKPIGIVEAATGALRRAFPSYTFTTNVGTITCKNGAYEFGKITFTQPMLAKATAISVGAVGGQVEGQVISMKIPQNVVQFLNADDSKKAAYNSFRAEFNPYLGDPIIPPFDIHGIPDVAPVAGGGGAAMGGGYRRRRRSSKNRRSRRHKKQNKKQNKKSRSRR